MSEILSNWWNADNNLSTEEPTPLLTTVGKDTKDPNAPLEFVKSPKVYIDYSLVGGRGIFALEDIKEGDLIERCILVPMELRSNDQKDRAVWTYCYTKPLCDCSICKEHGFLFYMVLGYGMIYNHQDDNNAEMIFDHKNYYVDIKALKNISKDQEVFVYYGKSYFNSRPKVIIDNNLS